MTSKLYLSPLCSCIVCKQIKSVKGIHSHYRTAHTKEGNEKAKFSLLMASAAAARSNKTKIRKLNTLNRYNLSPNNCSYCSSPLSYNKRNNKFCSHSCSALTTNTERIKNGYIVSKETKIKTSNTLKSKLRKGSKQKTFKCRHCKTTHFSKEDRTKCCIALTRKMNIKKLVKIETNSTKLEFTPIKRCTCKRCEDIFYHTSQIKYCRNCKQYHSNIRSYYRFKFNLFDYPDLFDLTTLIKIGFYAPGGKSGRWNLDGLSRDHKVSVSEAIAKGYDSYYISHPCNCELMPHRLNGSKKGKSSITYKQLIQLVTEYDLV